MIIHMPIIRYDHMVPGIKINLPSTRNSHNLTIAIAPFLLLIFAIKAILFGIFFILYGIGIETIFSDGKNIFGKKECGGNGDL